MSTAAGKAAGNAPSTSDVYEHTGLSRGTYYYALFAHDEAFNYATPALAQATVLPGDFDGDDDIDLSDFGHLQSCLSGAAIGYGPGCRDADLDADGDVDLPDVNTFNSCIGGGLGFTPGYSATTTNLAVTAAPCP